jgi:uncharacterized membrane protein (UPF0127 family)
MTYKKLLLSSFLLVTLAVSGFLLRDYSFYGNKLKTIRIGEKKFRVEVVDTPSKTSKGLGERKKICEKCGMLFEFQEKKRYSFWMEGMKFDLDIIWIDGSEIVHIAKNVPYLSREIIMPESKADRVLEINAGLAEKYGLKIGDKILLDRN